MARQIINVGTAPNDGTGDTLKTSFTKCNANFLELYSAVAGVVPTTISDTPPGSPTNGSLWWESDTGILWISYNDGTSTQWVAVAGGSATVSGLVLLNTVTATAAATVDFTSLLTGAFDEYEVHFSGAYSSSDADTFLCRVGQVGVYQTTAGYYYALNVAASSGVNAPSGSAAGGGVVMSYPALVSNLAARALSGKMSIAAPLGTVAYKQITFNSAYVTSTNAYHVAFGAGMWAGNTNAVDSLRFQMLTGTISGTFKLYGVR
jgi:hypothetical protein